VELGRAKGWKYSRNEQGKLGVGKVRHPTFYHLKSPLELNRIHMTRFRTKLGIFRMSKASVALDRVVRPPPEPVCVGERVILPGVRVGGRVPGVEVVIRE